MQCCGCAVVHGWLGGRAGLVGGQAWWPMNVSATAGRWSLHRPASGGHWGAGGLQPRHQESARLVASIRARWPSRHHSQEDKIKIKMHSRGATFFPRHPERTGTVEMSRLCQVDWSLSSTGRELWRQQGHPLQARLQAHLHPPVFLYYRYLPAPLQR